VNEITNSKVIFFMSPIDFPLTEFKITPPLPLSPQSEGVNSMGWLDPFSVSILSAQGPNLRDQKKMIWH